MLASTACRGAVNRFTINQLVDEATDGRDLDAVCGMGRSLTLPLQSFPKRTPHRGLIVAEGVSAMCAELDAWNFELVELKAKANYGVLGEARVAEIVDAQVQAKRRHALAAARFERSFQHLVDQYGPIGEDSCADVPDRRLFEYQFGLISGTLALFHDRAAEGAIGIPLDRPLEIARGALCLDDTAWWGMGKALRGAAWATIPGSSPEGVDPWAMMAEAADQGDETGIRVSRAIQVLLAANAGERGLVEDGIRAFASSESDPDPDWLLLDEYARTVVLHQSDRLWMDAAGHRTERLGVLPSDAEAPLPGADAFDDDPFGADPFAENAEETTP